jgi:hypothetical protein
MPLPRIDSCGYTDAEMHLRLNGWQRIGIVGSVLWVITAGLVSHNIGLRRAEYMSSSMYSACADVAGTRHDYDFSGCKSKAEKTYEDYLTRAWADALLVSFVPIPFAWLVAYMIVGVWRWVKRGFKTPSSR